MTGTGAEPATQDLTAILAAGAAVATLVLSVIIFMVQRTEMRRRELWWAIVEDNHCVEVGVPVTFRLYRYIGKYKPKRKKHPCATVIRGYVLVGESLIGREKMGTMEAMREMWKRSDEGEKRPDVPDEVHPPKVTMVPLKVIRYGG